METVAAAGSWVWFEDPVEKWLPCRVSAGGSEELQLVYIDESGTERTYAASGAKKP